MKLNIMSGQSKLGRGGQKVAFIFTKPYKFMNFKCEILVLDPIFNSKILSLHVTDNKLFSSALVEA